MNTAVKIFKEEGKTMIVFENPSDELNRMIEKVFLTNPVAQFADMTGMFTNEKKPEKAPSKPSKAQASANSSGSQNSQNNILAACKQLLADPKKQAEMGIDAVIRILADTLGLKITKCDEWLKTASQEQKVARYQELVAEIQKMK